MKKIVLLFAIGLLLSSCGKDTPGLTADEYIAANNLETIELAEGVHIIINAPGTGNRPNINSKIKIAYVGKLTDGTVFDSSDSYTSLLTGLIKGWQIGLPEIGIGGSCTLIIPADAGYGSRETSSIPANSTLVFDIDLIDIIL